MRFISSLILTLAAAASLTAAAQDIPDRVGRIAFIEGSAAVYQDPDEGWQTAYVNSPVSSENSLWTDPGSRAEMRIGATALRLDEATQVDLSRLDDNELAAYIPRGTVAVRVRHLEQNERIAFSTPHATFTIRANGRYRIDVDPDREESRLTVFTGDARVGSDSGRLRVGAGNTVRIFGGSSPSYVLVSAVADPFDGWAQQRDAGWVETRSVQYLSSNMTGYEDLDRYGQWSNEADLGALWYPTHVASDWAPYRYGRWDYVRPWGWTWIDDASWGYAPFHYGRWVQVRDRWAWSPGKREQNPVWAPALVAWIGGAGFNATLSSGSPSVGWYPLSPWERYQPWYNASPTYVNQVNVVVLASPQRDDQRQWSERTRDRGATVVSREAVVDRRPVQQARVAFKPEILRQAASVTTPAAVLPARNEVIQRRQSARVQAAPSAAPSATGSPAGRAPTQAASIQRGERAGPVAKPDFTRRPAAAPPAPEPAKSAPPPVQRIAAPSATGLPQAREPQNTREAQQKGRAEAQKGREAEAQKSREAQQLQQTQQRAQQQDAQKAREAQVEQQRGREADAQKARETQLQQQQAQQRGREADAQKARETQLQQQQAQQKGREAEAQKSREAQQQQQTQQRAQQQDAQKAREAQVEQQRGREAEAQKAREAQQQQQAQQRAQQQQEAQKAREAQQQQTQQRAQQQQETQKAREAQQQQQAQQRAQQQQEAQKAREAQQQQQAQQRAQQQQEAQKAREAQQPQAQQRGQQPQAQEREAQQKAQPPAQERAPPPQRTQPQRQEKGKAPDDSKDDDEKKARSR